MSDAPMTRDRELKWIPTEQIIKNENNPRRTASFTPDELENLRASIVTHGVLEPVIVAPYDDDMFELIDGERRWTSARLEAVKELPAIVVNKMDDHDQVVVMYNVHTQHRGWEMAEELAAIKRLLAKNGHRKEDELARELGMSLATFQDRLRVMKMGDDIVIDIATEKLDYSSALRADQVARTLARRRPKLVDKLGGEDAVEKRLISKAKARSRGISQELVQYRAEFADPTKMPDAVVEQYLESPEAKMRDVLHANEPLEQRRKTEELSEKLTRLEREISHFDVDRLGAGDLKTLRRSIASLMDACQALETRVVQATMKRSQSS